MRFGLSRSSVAALLCCVIYFTLGSAWLDLTGIQADEAIFAQPLFQPEAQADWVSIFHHHVPLMLLSYLGCLKTWLYAPLLALFPATATVIRLPMVAAGALTIWLVFCIVRELHSPKAGLMAAALLATDPMFLWLHRADWGPVALQHLLTSAGVWMLLRFHATRKAWWLGGGFFLFGLALWDKTVFLWMGAALIAGCLALIRLILPHSTARHAALAILCFSLGAFPWIRHNVRHRGATFDEAGRFSFDRIDAKAANFIRDLNGGPLLGWMIRERPASPGASAPDLSLPAQFATGLSERIGDRHRSVTGWLFLMSLFASPFLKGAPRTAALMFLAAFASMASTKDGGESVHHAVILWPLPQIVIALVFARLPKRIWVPTLAATGLAALAVTATHFAHLHRFGAEVQWTDAIYRLPTELQRFSSNEAKVVDWGILEPALLLSNGKASVKMAITRGPIHRGDLFISHVPGREIFPDSNSRLADDARAAGCHLKDVAVIPDRFRVPMLRIQTCD